MGFTRDISSAAHQAASTAAWHYLEFHARFRNSQRLPKQAAP